ncbi:GNAT family N-acetyltransferase [Sphingobacterium sp. 2149]|uniref:GNAT family N-acetyltransferase n=1 Tax=Sphingobacterium sp. 2149 TaxID=2817763 RepID=UPI0028653E93|nr:GNAT family N-acetyltransferase [Sphingobacterium sp. 2149]MDR6735283.1 ribosomal protein S18 acetylase RimI-like enzyme [Sphingobacterium sp. 2149]
MENKKVNKTDAARVVDVICSSFVDDPCFKWMIGKKNFEKKIYFLANYIVEETLINGEIFIDPTRNAVALWQSQNKTRLTAAQLFRNLKFLLYMGPSTVFRSLKLLKLKDAHISDQKPYLYLACIGVMPSRQGKGLAKGLLDPVLTEAENSGKDVYLETANPLNVRIYRKKGFEIIDEVALSDIRMTFMVRRSSTMDKTKSVIKD